MAKLVRWMFGLQALFYGGLLVGQPWVLWRVAHATTDPEILRSAWRVVAMEAPICAGMAVVFFAAWWTLGGNRRFGRIWALTASVLSLPLLGIGTLTGVFGLIVFWKADPQIQPVRPKSKLAPLPGDGTSRLLEFLAQGAGLTGAVAGNFFWTWWGSHRGLPVAGLTSFLVQLELAAYVSVLVHEAGHVLGGWASHMKLGQFSVGAFDWRIRSGKWEFKFDFAKLLISSGCAGLVLTSLNNIRSRRVFVSAAGPAASLLLGLAALAATLGAPGRAWQPIWLFCSLTATISLLSFAVNLVPMRPQDQYSDGAHIYQLVTRGPWADVHIAFSIVASSLVTALRPRDYDMDRLSRGAAFLTAGREGMLLRLFAYLHFVDLGRNYDAIQWLTKAEALYPAIAGHVPADLHADFVFGNAFYRRDAAAARMWWERMEAKGITRFDVDYWKARAALAWIENRTEDARDAWQQAHSRAAELPKAGAYDFDRESIDRLRVAIESSTPPPLTAGPPAREPALAISS